MNTAIEILDNVQHQELKIDFKAARHASRHNIIPVVLSEFHALMFHFPIVFVKDIETGEFTCSVLMGINADGNLLDACDVSVDEGLPLNVRRLPLLTIASADSDDISRPLIGINMANPGVGQGEAIFKTKSATFDAAISALSELHEGYKETRAYVKKIVELDLIAKLNAEIHCKDKPTQILEGLYGIDVNKIARLRERDECSKNVFMEIASYAYAQNFSLYNMKKLAPLIS